MAIDDVKGALKDRLSSPIFGTFSLYFGLLNWKAFVHIFSSGEAAARIKLAQAAFHDDLLVNLGLAFCLTVINLFVILALKSRYEQYVSDREFEVKKHINKNLRNLKRDDADATEAISEVIARRNELNQAINQINGELTNLNSYRGLLAQYPSNSVDIKVSLEVSLQRVVNLLNQVKVSSDKLMMDASNIGK